MTTRLFVAIWPSDAAREALSHTVDEARRAAPDVRWQPPERWHITLAFLGPADPAKAARADRRVERAPTGCPAPNRSACTDPDPSGRSIWVGVEHGPWLADLARGLQASLHVADRRFRAHVTVGRARGADGPARATGRGPAALPPTTAPHGPRARSRWSSP